MGSWRKKGQDSILCDFDTSNSFFCIGNNTWIRLWALNMGFYKWISIYQHSFVDVQHFIKDKVFFSVMNYDLS